MLLNKLINVFAIEFQELLQGFNVTQHINFPHTNPGFALLNWSYSTSTL